MRCYVIQKFKFLTLCYMMIIQLLSCVRLLRLHGLQPSRLLCPWDFPGKNTGVGCHLLFQGIFLIQDSNLSPALQADSLLLSNPGKALSYNQDIHVSLHLTDYIISFPHVYTQIYIYIYTVICFNVTNLYHLHSSLFGFS